MKLNELPKIKTRGKKRVGRGYGSGKGGHTSGRGAKGERVRGSIPLLFQGTKLKKSFVKRLPFFRGKDKFKVINTKPVIIKMGNLSAFKAGETVDLTSLFKKGMINEEARKSGVKILCGGELKVALKIAVPASEKAWEQIKKAGGEKVHEQDSRHT